MLVSYMIVLYFRIPYWWSVLVLRTTFIMAYLPFLKILSCITVKYVRISILRMVILKGWGGGGHSPKMYLSWGVSVLLWHGSLSWNHEKSYIILHNIVNSEWLFWKHGFTSISIPRDADMMYYGNRTKYWSLCCKTI